MRIDEIDLIGNFKIAGVVPSSGQGIGYSGSTIQWITVTSSGGGGGPVGYQGATGPSYNSDIVSREIAIGRGGLLGLTSSPVLSLLYNESGQDYNLALGLSGGSLRFSTFSVAINSGSSCVNNSTRSFVSSTLDSRVCISNASGIIGGNFNRIYDSKASIILGGASNFICDDITQNSAIVGGCNNKSYTFRSVIIAGSCNTNQSGNNLSILGGYKNCHKGGAFSTIIAGCSNFVCSSTASVILGGICNKITNSEFSSIIGGDFNTITASVFTAIIGATGVTLTNENGVVYMDKLMVNKTIYFSGSNPSPEDGDLWWDSVNERMRFRTNGVDYCIDYS